MVLVVLELVQEDVQEIVQEDVKDAHYHVQQLVVGTTLVVADHLALTVVVKIVEQDAKDVVLQQRQIDIVVIYLMSIH